MTETSRDLTLDSVAEFLEPSPLRRTLWIAAGALIVAVAVMGLVWDVSIWSAAFAVVGGLAGGRLLSIGLRGVPLLEWDSEGLTDRTSLIGGDLFVPWSQISSVTTSSLHSGVRLNLVANADCLRSAGPGRWLQARMNRARGFSGIEISPTFTAIDYTSLGRSLDEIVTRQQIGRVTESRTPAKLRPGDMSGPDPSSD